MKTWSREQLRAFCSHAPAPDIRAVYADLARQWRAAAEGADVEDDSLRPLVSRSGLSFWTRRQLATEAERPVNVHRDASRVRRKPRSKSPIASGRSPLVRLL